jgi:hypothetical protein
MANQRFSSLAACLLVLVATACQAQPVSPDPVLAMISRVDKTVMVSMVGQAAPIPARVGVGLVSGATVTTADLATAAIDFGAGEVVDLQSQTSLSLLRIATVAQGTDVGTGLNAGRLLAVMPHGSLEVSTNLGEVALGGSVSLVEFTPGTLGSSGDVFTVACLAGNCSVNTRVFNGDLGPGDRLDISNSGLTVAKSRASDNAVAALLATQSVDPGVALTLTAWPTGTGAPWTLTATPSPTVPNTPLPTRTLAPTRDTPTPEPTATTTPVPNAVSRWQNIDIPGVSNNFSQPSNNFGYNTVLVDPTRPNIVYVGTNYQGLYRSSDSGATWHKIDTGAGAIMVDGGRLWALALDPFNPNTLYAASGYGSGGPLKSTDGGISWSHTLPIGNATEQRLGTNDIYSVVLDPYTPNHLLASFHSKWSRGASDPGLIESADGGRTWTIHNPPAGSGWGAEISVWFVNNSATWIVGSQNAGFWRTTNSGTSWIQVSPNNMAAGGVYSVYRDPTSGTLYAAYWDGIMKSVDNGASWTDFSAGLPPFATFETVASDGANLYTAPSYPFSGDYAQAHGPWYTVPAAGSTWVSYNDQQTCDNSNNICNGPVMMARDATHNTLYSVNWLGGVWKLMTPP